MPRYNEFKSCTALMEWWAFYSRINKIPEHLLFHCPNATPGSIKYRANNKRMGVRAGTPDYVLAMARGKHHGLFIEMKSPEGRPSPAQTQFMQDLTAQGYCIGLCYGMDPARRLIESYLSSK
jgi:hypothetical protein